MRDYWLLVEDNEADIGLIKRCLGDVEDSPELKILRDGKVAESYLFDRSQQDKDLPALVILDVNLPGQNGLSLLEKIRNHDDLEELSVVVLTSSKSTSDREKSYQLEASSFITKPDTVEEFRRVIKDLLDYRGNAALSQE